MNSPSFEYLTIAMTPRSGSTLFCSCVEAAGVASPIGEIFNPRGPKQYFSEKLGAKTDLDLLTGCKKFSPKGNLSVFKVSALDFRNTIVNTPIIAEMLSDNFIFVDRADKILQGISLYVAKESGTWHLSAGATTTSRNSASVEYDFQAIRREVDWVTSETEYWEKFFLDRNIQPVRVIYEEFLREPESVVSEVLLEVGLETVSIESVPLAYNKITDSEVANTMKAKFLRELRNA